MPANSLLKVAKFLTKTGQTLSVAESCTGGLLGAQITAASGSSNYFAGGLIAYSDRVKTERLGVRKAFLKRYGAVSAVVAEEMARNVRRLFKTDYGVSITGIAGPKSDKTDKPVGLVFIAVSTPKKIFCKKYQFTGTRYQIRSRTSREAINLLLQKLKV